MKSRCVSGKRMFNSQTIAENVLIELWSKKEYTPDNGPVAIYKCEDCGYYHFTSQGPMNERLAEAIKSGEVKRQSEVNRWEAMLKHKR